MQTCTQLEPRQAASLGHVRLVRPAVICIRLVPDAFLGDSVNVEMPLPFLTPVLLPMHRERRDHGRDGGHAFSLPRVGITACREGVGRQRLTAAGRGRDLVALPDLLLRLNVEEVVASRALGVSSPAEEGLDKRRRDILVQMCSEARRQRPSASVRVTKRAVRSLRGVSVQGAV